MKSTLRSFIAVFVFGMICLSFIGCSGCRGKAQPQPVTSTDKPTPVPPEIPQEGSGEFRGSTQFSIGLSGHQAWSADVQSGRYQFKNKQQKFTLIGLTCHLYKKGKEVLQVSADTGTAVRTGSLLKTDLRGHIHAIEKTRNQQLLADSFQWTSTEDTIHVTNFTWTDEKTKVHADEGTVSTDFNTITMSGPNTRVETSGPLPRK